MDTNPQSEEMPGHALSLHSTVEPALGTEAVGPTPALPPAPPQALPPALPRWNLLAPILLVWGELRLHQQPP